MAHIEPLIDAYEAAQILRLHPVTVREMAARREIPGLKIGKVWRFRASSLDEWVNSRLAQLPRCLADFRGLRDRSSLSSTRVVDKRTIVTNSNRVYTCNKWTICYI